MCNRYHPTRAEIVEAQWDFGELPTGDRAWRPGIGPWGTGPFIRAGGAGPELVVGTWALIGDDDKKPINRPRMTNCARSEDLMERKTYRGPWMRGQRCLIPAERFDYPNWETKKNVWWTLRRADGDPWHLAGIWNTWTDRSTGEVFESYSMLTQNCDGHSLLSRFHKPEPDLPLDKQDKRTVVPLAVLDFRIWLNGTNEEAEALIRVPPAELYDARPDGPAEPAQRSLVC
jgi:putative SOS response-associated peptidase YedK